jgi:hypothetical protein
MSIFHLSRAVISIIYSGGKINFESASSLSSEDDPVQLQRIMDTDQKGGYLEFETGLNEPRMATLTVKNINTDKLDVLISLFETKEPFTLTLVDTKDGSAKIYSQAKFKIRPEQKVIDGDQSFDVALAMLFSKVEYA